MDLLARPHAVIQAGLGAVHALTDSEKRAHPFVSWFAAAVLLLALVCAPASAQPPAREYQVKAVFLFNFLQFVEWPKDAFDNPRAPVRIGVLGEDPFGAALDAAVRGETIDHRPLVVRRSNRIEDLEDCHMLFVGGDLRHRLEGVLSRLSSQPILTVSEIDGFARHGGVIAFYQDGKKVRFEINIAAARHHRLKLSSELLSLGRVIGTDALTEGGPDT